MSIFIIILLIDCNFHFDRFLMLESLQSYVPFKPIIFPSHFVSVWCVRLYIHRFVNLFNSIHIIIVYNRIVYELLKTISTNRIITYSSYWNDLQWVSRVNPRVLPTMDELPFIILILQVISLNLSVNLKNYLVLKHDLILGKRGQGDFCLTKAVGSHCRHSTFVFV